MNLSDTNPFLPSKYPPGSQHFPRILGIYMDDTASSYYRIHVPFKMLREAGYPVGWGHVDDIGNIKLDAYDMIVISRTGTGDPEAVRMALDGLKRAGKVVALDYDDDVLNIPPWNPASGQDTAGTVMAMRCAHGLIVTNLSLAASLRVQNPNIQVFGNFVDPRLWPVSELRFSDKLTVGLTGSITHGKDWEIVAEPMRRIRQEFDIEFLTAGYTPDYLEDIVTTKVGWVPLTEYGRVMNGIDIGLCPLIEDRFNRCKTPIKAYEYGLAGAAVVASPTQYLSVVKGKGTIARTEEEWYEGIKKYIVHAEKRNVAARSLKQYVETRINVARHIQEIAGAYRTIYRRAVADARKALAA